MGRKKLDLQETLIQNIVSSLQAAKDYSSRSELFNDVVNELVKNLGFTIFSASVVGQRINTWPNFKIKTSKARPRLQSGGDALQAWRDSGGDTKRKKVDKCDKLLTYFSKEANGKYLKLAKAVKRGSLKAAVKLKCLDCANFQKEEIKHCQCFECPLWPIRPFQVEEQINGKT